MYGLINNPEYTNFNCQKCEEPNKSCEPIPKEDDESHFYVCLDYKYSKFF
jgi:hypothetical protein